MIVFLFFVLLIVICFILLYKDQRITFLGYHDFTEGDSVSNMQMNIKNFDKQMKYLKDNNYKLAFTIGPGKNHRKVKLGDDKYHLPRLFISSDMPFWKFILRLVIPY